MTNPVQRLIDIKNLRFYAEMFRQHEWGTVQIHWGVFEQTIKEIANRIEELGLDTIDRIEAERDTLRQRLEQANKLQDLTVSNEIRWMKKHSEAQAEVERLKAELAQAQVDRERPRCEICDWPIERRAHLLGCVPGNCSYRPEYGSPEWARTRERRKALDAARKPDGGNDFGT